MERAVRQLGEAREAWDRASAICILGILRDFTQTQDIPEARLWLDAGAVNAAVEMARLARERNDSEVLAASCAFLDAVAVVDETMRNASLACGVDALAASLLRSPFTLVRTNGVGRNGRS